VQIQKIKELYNTSPQCIIALYAVFESN